MVDTHSDVTMRLCTCGRYGDGIVVATRYGGNGALNTTFCYIVMCV